MDFPAVRRRILEIACRGDFGPRVFASKTILERAPMRNAVQDAIPGVTFMIQVRKGKAWIWATERGREVLELSVPADLLTMKGSTEALRLLEVYEVLRA